MHPRTKRQKEVLDIITGFVDRNGYFPSYQYIARKMGLRSRGGIQRHITALEEMGLLQRRRDNGKFGISLTGGTEAASDATVRLSLVETDANGVEADPDRGIAIPRLMLGEADPADHFAYRLEDDTLDGKHICPGDILIFEKRDFARRGDIVLLEVPERILKLGLFFNLGSEIELRTADPQHASETFASDAVIIRGVMRGLLRPIGSA